MKDKINNMKNWKKELNKKFKIKDGRLIENVEKIGDCSSNSLIYLEAFIQSLLDEMAKEMIDSQLDKIESHSPSFGSAIFSVDNSMKQELIKIAKKYGVDL